MLRGPREDRLVPATVRPVPPASSCRSWPAPDTPAVKRPLSRAVAGLHVVLGCLLFVAAMGVMLLSLVLALLLIMGLALYHGPEHEFARKTRSALQRMASRLDPG